MASSPGPVARWRMLLGMSLGLALLLAGHAATGRYLAGTPFDRYDFPWLVHPTPGEIGFTWRHALVGGLGAGFLAWGLVPLLRRLPPPPRAGLLPALPLLAALLVALGAHFLLRDGVVTDDEYAYLFQARALAHGQAALPAPPEPEFFQNVFVAVRDQRWFGQYPPGHPLVLVPGVLLGIPRAVPVLLAAANTALVVSMLRTLAGPGWALAGGLLLLTSPLFLLTGATLLSHTTAFFGLALAAWSALRARSPGIRFPLLTGLGVGLTFLARPYTGLVLGGFPLVLCLAAAPRKRRALLLALAGGAACAAAFLLYNARVTGDPFLTGYDALRRPAGMTEFGFGWVIPGHHRHTLAQGLRNAATHAMRFHLWALGWPLLGGVIALWAWARRRPRAPATVSEGPASRVAAGAGTAVLVGLLAQIPYWSIGVNDTGPVKDYELLLPFVIWATLAGRELAARIGSVRLGALALGSFAAALLVFWPSEIRHLREVSAAVREPLRRVEAVAVPPALVFVEAVQTVPPSSWVFGRPNPGPGLEDPILYVLDRGAAANTRFWRERFPGRRAYGLIRSGNGVRAVEIRP